MKKVFNTLYGKLIIATIFITLMNFSTAFSEPMKIRGLSHKFNVSENIKKLEEKGFKCKVPGKDDSERQWWLSVGGKIFCENGEAYIYVSKDSIVFQCEVFNICQLNLKEVAQLIVNSGVINSLEHDIKSAEFDGDYYQYEAYCGRGDFGDSICVEEKEDMYSRPYTQIVLDRGTLGEDGKKLTVNFN
jgi:hypothetical protein